MSELRALFQRIWNHCHVVGPSADCLFLMPSGALRTTIPPFETRDGAEGGSYIDIIALPGLSFPALEERLSDLKARGVLRADADSDAIVDQVYAAAAQFADSDTDQSFILKANLFETISYHASLAAYTLAHTNTHFFVTDDLVEEVVRPAMRYEEAGEIGGFHMAWPQEPRANAVIVRADADGEVADNHLLEEIIHACDRQFQPDGSRFIHSAALTPGAVDEERALAKAHLEKLRHAHPRTLGADPALSPTLAFQKQINAYYHTRGEAKMKPRDSLAYFIDWWDKSLDIGHEGFYAEDLKPENLPFAKAEWFAKTTREMWWRCGNARNALGDPALGIQYYASLFGAVESKSSPLHIAKQFSQSVLNYAANHDFKGHGSDVQDFLDRQMRRRHLAYPKPQGHAFL